MKHPPPTAFISVASITWGVLAVLITFGFKDATQDYLDERFLSSSAYDAPLWLLLEIMILPLMVILAVLFALWALLPDSQTERLEATRWLKWLGRGSLYLGMAGGLALFTANYLNRDVELSDSAFAFGGLFVDGDSPYRETLMALVIIYFLFVLASFASIGCYWIARFFWIAFRPQKKFVPPKG